MCCCVDSGGGTWIPKGVGAGLPQAQLDARAAFAPELQKRLPPARRHIVLPQEQFFLSDYEPQWPETFLAGHEEVAEAQERRGAKL